MKLFTLLFCLMALSINALGASKSVYLNDSLELAIYKNKPVAFSYQAKDIVLTENVLMAKHAGKWRALARRMQDTKEVRIKGILNRFTKYKFFSKEIKFVYSKSTLELRWTFSSGKEMPLYVVTDSYACDDPLYNDYFVVYAPEDIRFLKNWIKDGMPEDAKAFKIINFDPEEEADAAAFYISVYEAPMNATELKGLIADTGNGINYEISEMLKDDGEALVLEEGLSWDSVKECN